VDALRTVFAFAGLVGVIGLPVGWLIGAGIARWSRHRERTARRATIVVVVLLLGIGIQQASAVRTVPRSSADARAHDYSLARLDQAMIVWACGINAVGAVIGMRRRVGRDHRPRGASYADERT
jgi:hypothetical protein